jgi:hypothetical protein
MKRMKWIAMAAVGVALFAELAIMGFRSVDAAPQPRQTICHNTGNGNITITVNGNAVDKHLSEHGDRLGACIRNGAS